MRYASTEITTIVLDLNGTLTVHGEIAQETKEKIVQLRDLGYKLILFTADIRGTASRLCSDLGIEYRITKNYAEKEAEMLTLETEKCAAIGNARIDIGTFKHAKLAIATLQAEGIHAKIIPHVDIIVPSVADALDLFLNEKSLRATLKE